MSFPFKSGHPAESDAALDAGAYIPSLSKISGGLREAGEVNRVEAWALKHVRTHAVVDAPVAEGESRLSCW